jgi:hypothetical protein
VQRPRAFELKNVIETADVRMWRNEYGKRDQGRMPLRFCLLELAVNFVQSSLAIAINAEKHLAITLRQRRLKLVTSKLFKNP